MQSNNGAGEINKTSFNRTTKSSIIITNNEQFVNIDDDSISSI